MERTFHIASDLHGARRSAAGLTSAGAIHTLSSLWLAPLEVHEGATWRPTWLRGLGAPELPHPFAAHHV
jgi:hypothetical protein